MIIKISKYLQDEKPKYVDILVGKQVDEKRFVDMYTIIHKNSKKDGYEYKDRIIKKVKTYFEEVLNAVRNNDSEKLSYLSQYTHEAKYTSLGYSLSGPGKGFGEDKFTFLVSSIRSSQAYNSNLISDILDVELYVDNVGVDIISDLVTNLIHDVLSEYTLKKVNELAMAHKIRYVKMNYWNEQSRKWEIQNLATVSYKKNLNAKEFNYLLVPYGFTGDDKQKERIIKKVFDDCVYGLYKDKVLSNVEKYNKYVHEFRNGDKDVYKKRLLNLLMMNLVMVLQMRIAVAI